MAILAFQAPVSGLRGKVGGQVYSANKSGPYLKAWAKGSNPRTERQTAHRGILVVFSQAWRDITASQRSDWDDYAALSAQDKINSLGETFSASGFNWFVQINIARDQAGQAQLDDAPTLAVPSTVIIDNLLFRTTAATPVTRFRVNSASPDIAEQHIVHAVVVNSDGVISQTEIRAFMVNVIPNMDDNVQFQDEVEEAFGTIVLGQTLFATIAAQNADGRQGVVTSLSAAAQGT